MNYDPALYYHHPGDAPECVYFSAFHRMLLISHGLAMLHRDYGLQCFFAEEIRQEEIRWVRHER